MTKPINPQRELYSGIIGYVHQHFIDAVKQVAASA
jgi:hypothetical protein